MKVGDLVNAGTIWKWLLYNKTHLYALPVCCLIVSCLMLVLCLTHTCHAFRPAIIHHLRRLPERPWGSDQSFPGGPTDEGAAKERTAGSRRQSSSSQQPEPQQWSLREGSINSGLAFTDSLILSICEGKKSADPFLLITNDETTQTEALITTERVYLWTKRFPKAVLVKRSSGGD